MTVTGVLIGVMASSVNTIINQRDIPVVKQAAIVQNNPLTTNLLQTPAPAPAPAPTQTETTNTTTQAPTPTQTSTQAPVEQNGSNLRR